MRGGVEIAGATCLKSLGDLRLCVSGRAIIPAILEFSELMSKM